MGTRFYKLTATGFITSADYYRTVVNNPKANARIKKKAEAILAWLDHLPSVNHEFNQRAYNGEITFEMWLKRSRQKRFKLNASLNKRRSYNNGLIHAYNRYIEFINDMATAYELTKDK